LANCPRAAVQLLRATWASLRFARRYRDLGPPLEPNTELPREDNPLWHYFQQHSTGPGIWKWEHYFDVYQRHLARFVGKNVHLVEVGIYSGGSLGMWRSYFGDASDIYGVDIEPACRAYANEHVSVFIGDQANRAFWKDFKAKVSKVDVFIDDGGHSVEQQCTTLQEMLPHLQPGGIYICEDIHREFNAFASFTAGLIHELNQMQKSPNAAVLESAVTPFQAAISSIHFYPYMLVIEKRQMPLAKLSAPKHGTEWQPFL
jgi:hypothetical protein